MKSPSQHQELLSKYTYKKDKPVTSSTNYTVYQGYVTESKQPVTIRVLKYPHVELGMYLQKLKEIKSDNVVRIYELLVEQSLLIMVTEQIIHGNVKKALQRCKRLEEADAIFLIKQILHGHVDLLRSGVNWFGTEEDIEFTDGGVKLSWNNGCTYNLINPFPMMFNRLVDRKNVEANSKVKSTGEQKQESSSILPFPRSKVIDELIRISRENASEISMNPNMKKRDKMTKKHSSTWMGIKEYKNKNEYFDEFSYFAVSEKYGFVRVKVYDSGKISPNLLQLNKGQSPSFSLIYDLKEESNKTIIVSSYSNDGSLQSYITKLKTAGVKLKENHIEFFIYSLFDPIRKVQESSLKSINMLHIKNIYIENGIPKIGEPIPTNEKLVEVLEDRADVPDFYHPGFKKEPTSRDPRYDTYSLGVLLYKLMYTEYPIFPNGKVHIPTTPQYNKRLKQSLEIFLNEGGTLKDISEKINVSEEVKKQVEENNQKLHGENKESQLLVNKKDLKVKNLNSDDQDESEVHQESESSEDDGQGYHASDDDDDDEDDGPGCYQRFTQTIKLNPPTKVQDEKKKAFVDHLELSSFKNFRLWSKTVFALMLFTLLFYYGFLKNCAYLLASQSLLTPVNLTIITNSISQNYTIITTDVYEFENAWNSTSQTVTSLEELHCLIQTPSGTALSGTSSSGTQPTTPYTQFLKDSSGVWIGYILGGLSLFAVILLLKGVQIHTFDEVTALSWKQNGQGHFNLSNWVLLNLLWLNLLSGHYFMCQFLFESKTEPCVGFKQGFEWGSTNALFNDHMQFLFPFVIVFSLQLLTCIVYMVVISQNEDLTPKYNFLLNPLSIFGVLLAIFWFMIRFGFILGSLYYPTALNDDSDVIVEMLEQGNFVLFFAILPEFLWLMELFGFVVINWVYLNFVDNSQRLLMNDMGEKNNDATLNALE